MKSKLNSRLFLLAFALPAIANAQASGDWRSAFAASAPTATVSSGDYNTAANWQKYDATAQAWVGATNKPGTSNSGLLTVLTGSAMTISASSGALNILVQSGGSIKFGTATAAQGLRLSGTSLVNNGLIGGAAVDDSINIELYLNNHQCTISGSGVTTVNRLRILGGAASTPSSGIHGIIAMPITFTNQSATLGSAVGLTAYYGGTSSAASDVDTITINPGVTASFINSAVLHYQSVNNTGAMGSYVYNINGVADMSASAGTSYFSPASTNAASVVTLNVLGTLKLGKDFSTMDSTIYTATSPTPGSVALNVLAGGIVDATPTTFKMDNTYAAAFKMDPSAIMKRFVGSSFAAYPVSTVAKGNNTLVLHNAGTADTLSVSIQPFNVSSVTTNNTEVVANEWIVKETASGAKLDTLKFTWLTADQGSAVTATPSVYYRSASGGQSEFANGTAVTVSGTGTAASPYVAVLAVPTGTTVNAGTFFVGKPGLTTAVANVANAGDMSVTVAPNPAVNKQINFQLSGNKAGTYKVAVYNMVGQAVYSNEVSYNAQTSNYSVNMSNMPAGIYQLQVSNGVSASSKRVVVE